jgi:hypothetical protein
MSWRVALAMLAAGLAAAATCRVPAAEPPARLIQWGWDQPDTAYLRAHVAEMERLPFDGVVLGARYLDGAGRQRAFEWRAFGRERITWAQLAPALADLRATPFRRFTENFLRMNVTPGDVDWFDDFAAVEHNARLAGRLVGYGRLRGVLLDVEAYEQPLFSYPSRPRRHVRRYADYASQVRWRGAQLMQAFQREAEAPVILLTFGYALAGPAAGRETRPYGLLGPFLDGLLAGARGGTRVVDGYEFAYGFRTAAEFERAYGEIRRNGRRLSAEPAAYGERMRAGFGLWLDYDWRRRGWSSTAPERNHFTPAGLETALAAALGRADAYVWLYGETPRFWPRRELPDAYVEAIRRARRVAGLTADP